MLLVGSVEPYTKFKDGTDTGELFAINITSCYVSITGTKLQ